MSAVEMLPAVPEPDSSKVTTTDTALVIASDLSFEEWRQVGHDLGRVNRASGWWIGDWVNYGAANWGEKYDEAEAVTGLKQKTLRDYAWVARQYELSIRIDNLSFGHHRLAAPIRDKDERRETLALAAAEGWGQTRLRAHLSNDSVVEPLGVYFGKGDKWRESTEPLKRYLAAHEKRDWNFGHVNPKEARKRIQAIDSLIAALIAARSGLEQRSHSYRLTA